MRLFEIFKKKNQSKVINDNLFGELTYQEGYGFEGNIKLKFFNKEYNTKIIIYSSDEKIDEIQYETFKRFEKNIKKIEIDVLKNILTYYNKEEKYSYGPEDEEENKLWWPEINSIEELDKNIHLESIAIPNKEFMKNRTIYMLFNRDWGGEDDEDNGVCAEIIDEKVTGVGYKEISY